jgi:hypothetical protein
VVCVSSRSSGSDADVRTSVILSVRLIRAICLPACVIDLTKCHKVITSENRCGIMSSKAEVTLLERTDRMGRPCTLVGSLCCRSRENCVMTHGGSWFEWRVSGLLVGWLCLYISEQGIYSLHATPDDQKVGLMHTATSRST